MKIFLDMDGVLCDFIGGCIIAHKKKTKHEDIQKFEFYQDLWGLTDEEFWAPLQRATFWSNLEDEKDSAELLDLVGGCIGPNSYSGFEIVTRPSYKHPLSMCGKLTWIKRKFGQDFSDVTFTENKYNLAGQGVLIDDSERNVERFREYGGKAILYPQYWNENRGLIDDRVEYVRGELEAFLIKKNPPEPPKSPQKAYVELPDEEVISVDDSTGARKGTKLARYDLIPAAPLRLLAKHFGEGAKKYDERNWEKGYNWSKSFAALNRHLWAFWSGEEVDSETGSLHMTAATWHAMALTEYFLQNSGVDDRPCHKSPKSVSRTNTENSSSS